MYRKPRRGITEACAELRLPLHLFAWQPTMRRAGLRNAALYLIRPDGYVASRIHKPTLSDVAIIWSVYERRRSHKLTHDKTPTRTIYKRSVKLRTGVLTRRNMIVSSVTVVLRKQKEQNSDR